MIELAAHRCATEFNVQSGGRFERYVATKVHRSGAEARVDVASEMDFAAPRDAIATVTCIERDRRTGRYLKNRARGVDHIAPEGSACRGFIAQDVQSVGISAVVRDAAEDIGMCLGEAEAVVVNQAASAERTAVTSQAEIVHYRAGSDRTAGKY